MTIEDSPFSSKIWEIGDLIDRSAIEVDLWNKQKIDLTSKFRFGDRSQPGGSEQVFINFGKDLLKRGLLRLPFDKTVFEFEGDLGDKRHDRYVYLCEYINNDFAISVLSLRRRKDSSAWESISKSPLILTSDNNVYYIDRSATRGSTRHQQDYIKSITDTDALTCIFGCVALSASCFVQKQVIVPTHLQKARSRAGKPPLYEFKIVELEIANSIHRPHIGTHASPVLHWRRGHYRRLSHSGNIIPVAPCLVGDAANGIVDKDYDARGLTR